MSVLSTVNRLFLAFIQTDNQIGIIIPTAAAPITLTGGKAYAFGAYGEFSASLAAQTWIVGVYATPLNTAVDAYQIEAASGAAAAEVVFDRAVIERVDVTAVGTLASYEIPLLARRRLAATTRLAGRVANAAAGAANTVTAKMRGLTSVGL